MRHDRNLATAEGFDSPVAHQDKNNNNMYKLRDYQQQASDAAVSFFRSTEKGNAIEVLPTGAGKSLIIADIAARLGAPVLIFQPSKEILEQNYMKYGWEGYGLYFAIIEKNGGNIGSGPYHSFLERRFR